MNYKFVTFEPCANAPIDVNCEIGPCEDKAIADTLLVSIGRWANVCFNHWICYGSKSPELVNILTTEPITICYPVEKAETMPDGNPVPENVWLAINRLESATSKDFVIGTLAAHVINYDYLLKGIDYALELKSRK